jgi:O-antigen/teichoic acid export membrane protein
VNELQSSSALKRRALSSFLWTYTGFAAGRGLFFVAMLILARILVPSDFGLVAFALALLSYLGTLADLGFGAALVQRADAHRPGVAATAFWIGLAASAALVALCWAGAPLLAQVAPSDEIVSIFRVLSLQLFIAALGNVHHYLLAHALEFKRLFGPELSSGLVKGVVSVGLALAGAGVWSLVVGQLAGSVARTVGLWAVSPWRPNAVLVGRAVPSLVRFGGAIVVVGILGEAVRNVDYLIVGARQGADALGFYFLAFRLPELVILALFEISYRVLFPFYSRLKDLTLMAGDGREALVEGYLRTVRLASLVSFPVAGVVAALAVPVVVTVYGEPWRPAALPLALISLWSALYAATGMPGTVFKALGRAGLMTWTTLLWLALLVPALWLAAGIGIGAVAGAQLAVQLVYFFFLSAVVARVLDLRWWATPAELLPGVLVAAPVALAVFPLGLMLPPSAALLAGFPAAALGVLLLLRLFFPRELAVLVRRARGLAGQDAGAPPVQPAAPPASERPL